MKKVELCKGKSGKWMWRIVSVKGKVLKCLATSGQDFTTKGSARRAYSNLWEYYHGAPKERANEENTRKRREASD